VVAGAAATSAPLAAPTAAPVYEELPRGTYGQWALSVPPLSSEDAERCERGYAEGVQLGYWP